MSESNAAAVEQPPQANAGAPAPVAETAASAEASAPVETVAPAETAAPETTAEVQDKTADVAHDETTEPKEGETAAKVRVSFILPSKIRLRAFTAVESEHETGFFGERRKSS